MPGGINILTPPEVFDRRGTMIGITDTTQEYFPVWYWLMCNSMYLIFKLTHRLQKNVSFFKKVLLIFWYSFTQETCNRNYILIMVFVKHLNFQKYRHYF